MTSPDFAELLRVAMPQMIVVVTALLVMATDLLFLRTQTIERRFRVAAAIASLGCAGGILRILIVPIHANLFDGMLIANPLSHLLQIALLILTIFTLLLSVDSTFTEHVAEYVLLVLFATVGMMFLVSTQDLLVIFVSLELLSLSLYALVAFSKHSAQSWEAALKYFLFGGISAACLLYGFSLLYGFANSTRLVQISAAVHGPGLHPLVAIAIVTTAIGLGFKIAAAPFHFWAPDVYQGAPAPTAALIASSSKVASFFVLFQIMAVGFAGAEGTPNLAHPVRGWVPVLALLAVLSMLLGNLAALRQTSLRRLLAYSAIAHTGYMLLGVVGHTGQSLAALTYYTLTYALATIGAFAVVSAVERHSGGDAISGLAGLSRDAPALAASLAVFLLSLAGIPPLAGFFGKFYLFASLLRSASHQSAAIWLVAIAIAMSAVSLYYYLRVLKAVYVAPVAEGSIGIRATMPENFVAIALALAVFVFGCAPNLLLRLILNAIGI